MRLVERRLADCIGDVPGDTNSDCRFDVEDVKFMQFYIVGIITDDELSDVQQIEMDADLSGAIEGGCAQVSLHDQLHNCRITGYDAARSLHSGWQRSSHAETDAP